MDGALSISRVAQVTGVSVHAIRYFEAEGMLLRPIPRAASGHRRFEPEDVDWLLLCNRFRASGMPIAKIIEFADLIKEGPGNEGERLEVLRTHQRRVRARLAELEAALEVISAKVCAYERHLASDRQSDLWNPARSQ